MSEVTEDGGYPFACCGHCGCATAVGYWTDRSGHDDSCAHGCNDADPSPVVEEPEGNQP